MRINTAVFKTNKGLDVALRDVDYFIIQCVKVGSTICAWENNGLVLVVQYIAPELSDLELALQQQLFEESREVEV